MKNKHELIGRLLGKIGYAIMVFSALFVIIGNFKVMEKRIRLLEEQVQILFMIIQD